MIPDPIPSVCWGRTLLGSTPCSKIRTTDGPAFVATSMIADDSSTVTGCTTLAAFGPPAVPGAAARSRAPLARSASTVPPDASTAAASAAASTVPVPEPTRPALTGVVGGFSTGVDRSNHRSGVGSGWLHRPPAQSVRVSGAGEYVAAGPGRVGCPGVT